MVCIPSPPFQIIVREASPYKTGSVRSAYHPATCSPTVAYKEDALLCNFALSALSSMSAEKRTVTFSTVDRYWCGQSNNSGEDKGETHFLWGCGMGSNQSEVIIYLPEISFRTGDVCNASRSPHMVYPTKEQGLLASLHGIRHYLAKQVQ